MHLLNWASPTPGASEVGLPHVIARPRFHLRPALKLPEQHFHFSAVVCILFIHLQPASRSPTGRQLSLAFSRFICSVHRGPPPYHFHFSALSTVMSPVLGATDAYCTLQLGCPRRPCGRMHPHSSSALCSRAARGGPVVECIRTVHLHSAAVLPKEVLWSTCGQMHPQSSSAPCSLSARVRTRHKLAGTGFSCTLQPFSPRG